MWFVAVDALILCLCRRSGPSIVDLLIFAAASLVPLVPPEQAAEDGTAESHAEKRNSNIKH